MMGIPLCMLTDIVGVAFYFHVRMCLSFLISVTFSLAVIMAGQSVKASAEMLKNAVTANPTAKHTATVGKSTLESMCKASLVPSPLHARARKGLVRR